MIQPMNAPEPVRNAITVSHHLGVGPTISLTLEGSEVLGISSSFPLNNL
jgi:hypothetical protein